MRDEPDANAMPAASSQRQVGRGVVACTVGPRDDRSTTEAKIVIPRVAVRPTAGVGGERAELFGSRRARAGEGGCLGARQGGLLRRRLGAQRSGWLTFGAAVG